MTTYVSLDRLKPGQACTVCEIGGDHEMRMRLEELGLIAGTDIVCLMVSPLGDPIAYRIRESMIALRRHDACAILVKTDEMTPPKEYARGRSSC